MDGCAQAAPAPKPRLNVTAVSNAIAHFTPPAQGSAARAPQADVKRAFAAVGDVRVLETEHK